MRALTTSVILMIVLFSSVDCNCISNKTDNNNITQEDRKSTIFFFKKLVETKVSYEHALYFKDSNNTQKYQEKYFRLLDIFYSKKGFYIDCINYFLENDLDFCKNHLIEFSFYPKWYNVTPKCGQMSYENFLRTLLYNLEIMLDNYKELKCEESVFKDNE